MATTGPVHKRVFHRPMRAVSSDQMQEQIILASWRQGMLWQCVCLALWRNKMRLIFIVETCTSKIPPTTKNDFSAEDSWLTTTLSYAVCPRDSDEGNNKFFCWLIRRCKTCRIEFWGARAGDTVYLGFFQVQRCTPQRAARKMPSFAKPNFFLQIRALPDIFTGTGGARRKRRLDISNTVD